PASRLILKQNGTILFSTTVPAVPGAQVTVGRNPGERTDIAAEFGGDILRVIAPANLSGDGSAFDAIRLNVIFPLGRAGIREPLVVAGETGRGDLLFVEYTGGQGIRFG